MQAAACQPSSAAPRSGLCRSAARPSQACRARHRAHAARQPSSVRAQAGDADQAPGPLKLPITLPIKLNSIPHERKTRKFFYDDVTKAVGAALAAGRTRVSASCTIPELNTEFDVYRVGTLLELVRSLAVLLAADGKRVKVCVQQPLGQGVFQGTPLALSGVMRIMKQMDWGAAAEFVSQGNLGAGEVDGADAFVLVAPQNIVGHSVLPLLEEMVSAAEAAGKPLVLVNPKLGDVQSAGGVMGVIGRGERMEFAASFEPAYHFRLLYVGASMYPIMGALRYAYPGPWQVYRRRQQAGQQEDYEPIADFESRPGPAEITDAFKAASKKSSAW